MSSASVDNLKKTILQAITESKYWELAHEILSFFKAINGKFTNDFFIDFNDQKFGKSSLFGWNGYRHAIFRILFYES